MGKIFINKALKGFLKEILVKKIALGNKTVRGI